MTTEVLAVLDDRNDPGGAMRRRFFIGMGAAALGITASGGAVVFLQFVEPNILFEPPTRYGVGSPEDYAVDSVVSHPGIRVFVVRTVRGFFALSSVCTHLGCIARWMEQEKTILCPCHGSRFGTNGDVLSGPAPEPLRHLAISLRQDGELMVDTAVKADPDVYLRV